MNWFRTKSQSGVGLALIALALQLVLSFGHVHHQTRVDGLRSAAVYGVSECVNLRAEPASLEQLPARSSCERSQHSSTSESDAPNDICAICAVLALASVGLHHVSPIAELPIAIKFSFRGSANPSHFEDHQRWAFQPRGPPAA